MHNAHRTSDSMLLLATALFLASLGSVLVEAQARKDGPTVWDGVYTDAQAERATAIFGATCANCHTLASQGNRPLTGEKFWEGFIAKDRRRPAHVCQHQHAERQRRHVAGVHLQRSRRAHPEVERFPGRDGRAHAGSRRQRADHSEGRTRELPANTLVRVVGCLSPERKRLGADERDDARADRQDGRGPGGRQPSTRRPARPPSSSS